MISIWGKKVLLLSYVISGVIIGMETLDESNCHVMLIKESTGTVTNNLIFFHKNDPTKALFTRDFFNHSIQLVRWDKEKRGFLNIHFDDGDALKMDVNKLLKIE